MDFLKACRPIIRLNTTFLKGPYGGILLVVMDKDTNDQYLPLTIGVVETENKELLIDDISHDNGL